MNYAEWERQVPETIRREALWNFAGYRKALFVYDICWIDCEKMIKFPLGKPIVDQLIRSVGSISANIEEGYGRGFGKDRDYFLRVALGSARESKGWYYRAKNLLAAEIFANRLELLGEVIALLITEINKHRRNNQ
jgi:four helix bundle protein